MRQFPVIVYCALAGIAGIIGLDQLGLVFFDVLPVDRGQASYRITPSRAQLLVNKGRRSGAITPSC
jgi:hypothetical protein